MKRKVFFDTWGWVSLAHKNDSHHKNVSSFFRNFITHNGIPVTTDLILAETITILRARTNIDGCHIFIDTLLTSADEGGILLARITKERWEKAWKLCKKYHDKPYISFVDFTSFVVMKELNIREVLSGDSHFEEVGFGFKKLF